MTGLAVGLAVSAGLAGAVQAAVMGELGGAHGNLPRARLLRSRAVSLQALSQRPTMSSGLTGTRVRSRPVAARSAATTAAVETTVGGSPTPFTP